MALARECFAELFVNIALAGVCTFVTKKASFGCSDSSFRVTLNVGGVFCFSFFSFFWFTLYLTHAVNWVVKTIISAGCCVSTTTNSNIGYFYNA